MTESVRIESLVMVDLPKPNDSPDPNFTQRTRGCFLLPRLILENHLFQRDCLEELYAFDLDYLASSMKITDTWVLYLIKHDCHTYHAVVKMHSLSNYIIISPQPPYAINLAKKGYKS